MRIFLENEEQALGIILERIDAANARLVGTNEAHDAWTVLEAAHVVQSANRQYQLYQAMANTRQKPDEALPTYMQRVEQAADRFSTSLATGASADDIINMLVAFITVSNLDPTEDNENFERNLSITGQNNRTSVTAAFRAEQTRRDTATLTKESGLTARTARSPRQGTKPGSPTCIHCKKAHKSEDCYSKFPDKMPLLNAAIRRL
ncbi:hypothetical protein M407DRAFT_32710 [Tulasnella calospora MUT 4182]|uniref:Uncharacterized protein n=1 Tax=Tulasnella calospora MUT 4182 TaxID=1051891 RepID=A0A0C3PSD0_9AGAM|nr:hypothetical protein M407DRAFT_32710 [Tulasnella calospora MUT 4182]